ncbi:Uncharacterised protein [Mycobacteroides abscessus subsp. abscessus]|nr:Uncharacterised protein [Mycobacteroides abscessus subsp. abscessus]
MYIRSATMTTASTMNIHHGSTGSKVIGAPQPEPTRRLPRSRARSSG